MFALMKYTGSSLVRRSFIFTLFAFLSLPLLHAVEPAFYADLPMTDGTKIATDVYLPQDGPGPWPVVLVRSTYGRYVAKEDGYVKDGYAVVVQDVRGMGMSEGEKHVFYADTWRPGLMDGKDTVDWIKAQPWCNGKIGTTGGSALAMTTMLLAPTTHDLAAQTYSVTPSNFYTDTCYHGGVLRKNLMEGWLTAIGQPHIIDFYKGHPYFDDFWSHYDVVSRAQDITAPAVFNAQWFDIFLQGTINGFMSRELNGGPGARGNNYLVIRAGTHNGNERSPDFRFNKNRNSVPSGGLNRAFFECHLKGDTEALKKYSKVYYYVFGDDRALNAPGNEWRTADTWPPFPTEPTSYYLSDDNSLSLTHPTVQTASQGFTFDPAAPYPTNGGGNLFYNIPRGPHDQRTNSAVRNDLLKFSTAPLPAPVEVTGRLTVKLWVSTDAPDTDFTAMLLDIFPEGDEREINIQDSIQRVKMRETLEKPAPLLTGPEQIVPLVIDLQSTSWIFNTGHRIGLHISSSNYPRYEVNANTGADHPEGQELRVAHNRVHMDKDHPSAIILPVRPPAQ